MTVVQITGTNLCAVNNALSGERDGCVRPRPARPAAALISGEYRTGRPARDWLVGRHVIRMREAYLTSQSLAVHQHKTSVGACVNHTTHSSDRRAYR
ncbi:hypothetical protein EVAR_65564_1 [Eumeta japonica]|uniref:Uncharacterized protein n=1 Tax=Eumeta variegata TaxID=151549 RepID=A0A4C1ZCH3_EUMVA|nr:hypothetical protein EVAR_65564_1 [Eumeta japonica]